MKTSCEEKPDKVSAMPNIVREATERMAVTINLKGLLFMEERAILRLLLKGSLLFFILKEEES